jgi:hypothetical protein
MPVVVAQFGFSPSPPLPMEVGQGEEALWL